VTAEITEIASSISTFSTTTALQRGHLALLNPNRLPGHRLSTIGRVKTDAEHEVGCSYDVLAGLHNLPKSLLSSRLFVDVAWLHIAYPHAVCA
jgi:hypothetical protein